MDKQTTYTVDYTEAQQSESLEQEKQPVINWLTDEDIKAICEEVSSITNPRTYTPYGMCFTAIQSYDNKLRTQLTNVVDLDGLIKHIKESLQKQDVNANTGGYMWKAIDKAVEEYISK